MQLKDARKAARYSQEQAAELLGMSRPTYAKIEANPELATIEDAKAMADLFEVDISQIFFESDCN